MTGVQTCALPICIYTYGPLLSFLATGITEQGTNSLDSYEAQQIYEVPVTEDLVFSYEAVAIVGWGTDYTTQTPFWWVKTARGPLWPTGAPKHSDYEGYMRVRREKAETNTGLEQLVLLLQPLVFYKQAVLPFTETLAYRTQQAQQQTHESFLDSLILFGTLDALLGEIGRAHV